MIKFTREELAHTIKPGDVIQVVTPDFAGVGLLERLDENTLVLNPLDAKTLEEYTPKTQSLDAPTEGIVTTPTTVILALADIKLVFQLTKEPKKQDGE